MPQLTVQQAFDLALQHHQAGRLAEAEALYRKILAVQPNHAASYRQLGLVARHCGRGDLALEWLGRAVALDANDAVAHQNLSAVYFSDGRMDQALDACRRVIELRPAHEEAYNDFGILLAESGNLSEAERAFRQAIVLKPDYAEANNNLGIALAQQKRFAEAIAAYTRAIELKAGYADAQNNLGSALLEMDRAEDAETACRLALDYKPDFPEAHYNLGNAVSSLGNLNRAVEAYQRAIQLRPTYEDAYNNLGTTLADQGRLDEAVAAYSRALELNPNSARNHGNLANALHGQGKLEEAIAHYRRAIDLPGHSPAIYSNYLSTLQYWSETTPQLLLQAHQVYDRRYARPLRASWQPYANTIETGRRLRLGFVSPHFCFHPVGIFLIRLLENLDRRDFDVICYHDRKQSDAMTARLRANSTEWHDVRNASDEQLGQRIREDRVDILFDLAGHTPGNRLLVFARKPAPVQVTWLDYVGTTGLSAIDYILADSRQIPVGAEDYYVEKVLRMPDDYICFAPTDAAPTVDPLPAVRNGLMTFGSFNILPKTTPQIIRVWSRILHEVPNSRLLLKNSGFGFRGAAERVRQQFVSQSIDPGRIVIQGRSPHLELLASYNEVDIGLDTFPYNGGLTTCEALWMGVPVVTCPGETFPSRHGLAHLTAAGISGFVASDLDNYMQLAVSLAGDLSELTAVRAKLRQQVAASALCDGPRFAGHFATMMRGIWERWCAEQKG